MVITSIKRQAGNKKRLSVFVDGEYSFSLNEEDYMKLGLYENCRITADEIRRIKNLVNFNSAKSDAIRFVSLKIRSGKEVGEKLKRMGYEQDTADRVVDELKGMGYIDDRLYALRYVNDRRKLKPQSKRMLKYDLARRGIGEEIIDDVLAGVDVDEESEAYRIAKSRYGRYDINKGDVRRKVRMFLLRRGYSEETIRAALKRLEGIGEKISGDE